MIMTWFLPLGCLVGIAGTQTALKSRHATQKKDRAWWLLVLLSWLPSFCWIAAQFIAQY